jgi:hypothetical protein
MTHIDDAVITPGTGFIFVAPTGTARPDISEIESYEPMEDDHFAGWSSMVAILRCRVPGRTLPSARS